MTAHLETNPAPRRGQGLDLRISLVAERQCGAFSRSQALAGGATRASISRRLAAGRWVREFPGVYRISGHPTSWLRDLWCAFLAVGEPAVVTHETALRLQGVDSVALRPLTFTVPHGGHAYVPGTVVHQINDLLERELRDLDNELTATAREADKQSPEVPARPDDPRDRVLRRLDHIQQRAAERHDDVGVELS